MMSNAQQTELSVISTRHVIYGARAGTYFTQYVGPSSISTSQSLSPGDVLIDVESNTVCYIGINGQKIPWTSVAESVNTRHPTLQPHYILVPLQRRFSWLSYTGYKQWYRQALNSNPEDDLIVYIDRIKGGSHDLPFAGDLRMDVDVYSGTDRDAEGETDSGT